MKFSTKVVLMKIFVAIILKKLQRFESGVKVAGVEISRPKRTLEARMVRTDVVFAVSVEFSPEVVQNFPESANLFSHFPVWPAAEYGLLHSLYFQTAVSSSK